MSFFVVERVKESLRGVREVELVSEPGHFSFIKAENSQGQEKKRTKDTFSTCVLKSSLTFFFIIYLPTLHLGVITFFFLFFKSLKCDYLWLLYGLAA